MKTTTFTSKHALTPLLSGALVIACLLEAAAQDARFFRITGPVPTRITGITADGTVTWTNVATNATFTVQTATTLRGPANWVDYVQVPASNAATAFRLFSTNAPFGMALIPAGSFTMGNCMDPAEGFTDELPLHTVYVSAFYMDRYDVTKALWDAVKTWSVTKGYYYSHAGSGKASTHPVQTINWFDAVRWCNARSQKEGLTPCYYADPGFTNVYGSGVALPYVKWDAKGYRLPTGAEWEKAARGGTSGRRFPWSNVDTITHSQANYYSYSSYAYDISPTRNYHPTFATGGQPYTSPVGYFAANGYGLYDMAGNVLQWCWDWFSDTYYSSSPGSDPHGPPSGSYRTLRGGTWNNAADFARCSVCGDGNPVYADNRAGFRCVRGF